MHVVGLTDHHESCLCYCSSFPPPCWLEKSVIVRRILIEDEFAFCLTCDSHNSFAGRFGLGML